MVTSFKIENQYYFYLYLPVFEIYGIKGNFPVLYFPTADWRIECLGHKIEEWGYRHHYIIEHAGQKIFYLQETVYRSCRNYLLASYPDLPDVLPTELLQIVNQYLGLP